MKDSSIRGGAVLLMTMAALVFTACGTSLNVQSEQAPGQAVIRKLSLNGGEIVTIAGGLQKPFAVLAIDGLYLYFSEMGTGTIGRVQVQGGKITTLARGLFQPRDLAVVDGWVYFAELTELAQGLVDPMRIAVDTDYVYFCEGYSHIPAT